MKRKIVFFISFLICLVIATKAFSQNPTQPEYLIMISDLKHPEFLSSSKIYISMNGEDYKVHKIDKAQTQGKYDFNPILRLIRAYNKLGWKIMSSNLSTSADRSSDDDYLFIMMRRDQPYRIDHQPVDTIIETGEMKIK